MTPHNGSSPVFEGDEIRYTRYLLPRLIRVIFYRMGITNTDYLARYIRYAREKNPVPSDKEHETAGRADRRAIKEPKLTFSKMQHVMSMMGCDIECISVRLRERSTGQIRLFSTDESLEDLNVQIAKERDITLDSLGS